MFKQFLKEIRGNVALSTAVMALPIFMGAGVAVDYTLLSRAQSALQNAADSAVLASAKELALSNRDSAALKEISEGYVHSNLAGQLNVNENGNTVSIDTNIESNNSGLTVNLEFYWKPFLLHHFGNNVLPIRVSATANLAGSKKICMIGLDDKKTKTIHLTKRAQLEASGCGVYANSSHKHAIRVDDDASITTGVTCTVGGVKGAKHASFTPEPVTDCPAIEDPLIDRITPAVGMCDYNNFEIKTGIHTLYPGTYCGGLKVKGTAEARLKPGIYVINGSKLEVTDKAIFEGDNVGFFLAGDKAKLVFRKKTTINLSAPKTGLMAGLLMFEDRAASKVEKHEITSDNARRLLGTIYLPNGTLKIDSEGPIADQSAYTAIIARAIELAEGPTLYLNSDYEATDVPVPEGLVGAEVYLAK